MKISTEAKLSFSILMIPLIVIMTFLFQFMIVLYPPLYKYFSEIASAIYGAGLFGIIHFSFKIKKYYKELNS